MKISICTLRSAMATVFVSSTMLAFAQDPAVPSFEAADVKVNKSGEIRMAVDFQGGGRFTARNVPMKVLIALAYHVRPEALQEGPRWLESERFDIVAKAPQTGPPDDIRRMLQTLLAERFKLAVHTEQRIMPAYGLVAAKGGPKLQPSESAVLSEQRCGPGGGTPGQKHVVCRHMTMALLADTLQEIASRDLDVPVVDETGLRGAFDFKLDWTPAVRPTDDTPPTDPLPGPTLFEAVETQLGLRLESRRLPLPVIVIDSVERVPIEN